MATTMTSLLTAKLNTLSKESIVSAINEINTKALEHTESTAIHVTGDEKSKIALIKDGTTSQKGLVQLSDATNSTSTTLAATANAVKKAYDLANTANSKTVPAASTSAAGIVQLNDAVNSTSTTQAATANAAKKAYDLANGKYSKPSTGIPKTDLASDVQTSLGKADTAVQSIPSGTTSVEGIVQLSDATNSTSTALAATANAVKKAYDLANEAKQSANSGKTVIASAITSKGVSASSTDTFTVLASKIGQLGGGTAITKVTNSLTEPSSGADYDVWIKSSYPISKVKFDVLTPSTTTTSGETYIGVSNKQMYPSKDLSVGGSSITMDKTGSNFPVIAQGEVFKVHGSFFNAFHIDGTNRKVLDAYYRLNGQWIQFSFASDIILIDTASTTNKDYTYRTMSINASDLTVLAQVDPSNASHTFSGYILGFDKSKNSWISHNNNGTIYEFGHDLVLDKTVTRPNASTSKDYFEKDGTYYMSQFNESSLVIYNAVTNTQVSTVRYSTYQGMLPGFGQLNKEKTRMFHVRRGNGVNYGTFFIFGIDNIASPTVVWQYDYSNFQMELFILDDFFIHLKSNSGPNNVISIVKRNHNGVVLEEVATTIKTSNNGNYTLLGVDSAGNYYMKRPGSSFDQILIKIAPNGSTVYENALTGTIRSAFHMTEAGNMVFSHGSYLSLIDKSDGSIAMTYDTSRIINTKFTTQFIKWMN